jgi:hypothetical protein
LQAETAKGDEFQREGQAEELKMYQKKYADAGIL